MSYPDYIYSPSDQPQGLWRGFVFFRGRNQTVVFPNGETTTILVGQEKGVDVRIALDVVRLAREGAYDVALLFSQDQDLSD